MTNKAKSPGGQVPGLYYNLMNEKHLLIAGATGSGKSVLVRCLIYTGLHRGPWENQFVFIDPKRVELSQYRSIPHCLYYASEPCDFINALDYTLNIIETRFQEMQKTGERSFRGSDIYLIIDEFSDMLLCMDPETGKPLKNTVIRYIQRICQIGRAARVHCILCTQSPIAKVLPTEIKANFDTRIALKTVTVQDSRNILSFAGAETLPEYGQCIILKNSKTDRYIVPFISDSDIHPYINYWTYSNHENYNPIV